MKFIDFLKKYGENKRNRLLLLLILFISGYLSVFMSTQTNVSFLLLVGGILLITAIIGITYSVFQLTNLYLKMNKRSKLLKVIVYLFISRTPIWLSSLSTGIFNQGYKIAEINGEASTLLTVVKWIFWTLENLHIVVSSVVMGILFLYFLIASKSNSSKQSTEGPWDRKDQIQMYRDYDEIMNKLDK